MPQELPKIFHRIFTGTKSFITLHPVPAILGAIGLILFILGLISLLGTNSVERGIVFEEEVSQDGKITPQEIIIDVEGAVTKPGVYKLTGQPRIKDALIAASGLSSNADREWVAKNLNLAQKIIDGAKVYVPDKSQNAKVKSQNYTGGETGNININTASLSELETLPGIGAVTAQKIVDGRPYTDVGELLSKKVVGNAVFQKIKEKISVY